MDSTNEIEGNTSNVLPLSSKNALIDVVVSRYIHLLTTRGVVPATNKMNVLFMYLYYMGVLKDCIIRNNQNCFTC